MNNKNKTRNALIEPKKARKMRRAGMTKYFVKELIKILIAIAAFIYVVYQLNSLCNKLTTLIMNMSFEDIKICIISIFMAGCSIIVVYILEKIKREEKYDGKYRFNY